MISEDVKSSVELFVNSSTKDYFADLRTLLTPDKRALSWWRCSFCRNHS